MKADWVMTDEDKKEKKEISQQKRILKEVVADKTALTGATTQYEKRMRLVHTRVVYDKVRKKKNYFEIPAPLCRLNEENQERENSKHQIKTKPSMFSFDFEFPALEVPRS